jgi:hypothetical protein
MMKKKLRLKLVEVLPIVAVYAYFNLVLFTQVY